MTNKKQVSGLCINCLNSDDCRYPMNHTKPIIFCEEFSCIDPSESKGHIPGSIKKIDDSIDTLPKGLCSNCEDIKTCVLQKPDALVINCGEYR